MNCIIPVPHAYKSRTVFNKLFGLTLTCYMVTDIQRSGNVVDEFDKFRGI